MAETLDRNTKAVAGKEDEDTIEMEFSAEQALGLKAVPPEPRRGPRTALIPGVAAIIVLLSGISYFATIRTRSADVVVDSTTGSLAAQIPAAEDVSLPQPPADSAPVRFTNPFDASEIFEFPAGTSQREARDAVSELLLERARERRNPSR